MPQEALDTFKVVAYDPRWPDTYKTERDKLLAVLGVYFVALEHIGSTAVPNLRAKPIIDMMASVVSLQDSDPIFNCLRPLNYRIVNTDMQNRLLFRKSAADSGQLFHLHVLEKSAWEESNERIMRDFLLQNPGTAQAYGMLKDRLAVEFSNDSLAYTRAKTAFIQGIIDQARDQLGLPRVVVWTE